MRNCTYKDRRTEQKNSDFSLSLEGSIPSVRCEDPNPSWNKVCRSWESAPLCPPVYKREECYEFDSRDLYIRDWLYPQSMHIESDNYPPSEIHKCMHLSQ